MANEFYPGVQDHLPVMKQIGIELFSSSGVPTASGPKTGALCVDITNGKLYINTGTAASATWNAVGDVAASEITLAENKILIGAASGVAAAQTLAGDATIVAAGTITVTGANAAFNVGTNQTWTKEVNHTNSVADSTTANTAGGNLTYAAGKGTGTAAGGTMSVKSGASSNGTAVSPGASGAVTIASGDAGTATTGTAGAAGAVTIGGTAGGASTGASSTAGAGSTVNVTGGAGGASSGGSDVGGAGGDVILTSGAGGTGATAGIAGGVFVRGPLFRKSISATATDTTTLTTAQILAGTVRCTPTAAASYTMPTGTVLQAALPASFAVGDCVDFTLVNVATNDTFDITLVTAAGGTTLFGDLVVEANSAAAKNSYGTFRCEKTGANAFNVIRIG